MVENNISGGYILFGGATPWKKSQIRDFIKSSIDKIDEKCAIKLKKEKEVKKEKVKKEKEVKKEKVKKEKVKKEKKTKKVQYGGNVESQVCNPSNVIGNISDLVGLNQSTVHMGPVQGTDGGLNLLSSNGIDGNGPILGGNHTISGFFNPALAGGGCGCGDAVIQ